MAEKQPTAYVVCRWTRPSARSPGYGDNIPVKVFDPRREAQLYAAMI